MTALTMLPGALRGADVPKEVAASETGAAPSRIYIREYRVIGARAFPKVQVEEAVYPYLGPGRTTEDVEAARAALEKAYHDAGFQAASVQVPEQSARAGIVFLTVGEGRVGKLRVKGARFFLPSDIKAKARSLAEGRAVNFNDVQREIVALNQLPDRQVTPSLRPGEEPGTVDVDLTVVDKFPLHGSLELNNRYSADTSPLRLNASLSYNNLWQAGHTLGASFQVAPEAPDEVTVYTGYYIWRFPKLDWLSLMLQATKQESNVSTLGALAGAGRGEVVGGRAIFTLPPGRDFYHSATLGLDYKHFDQSVAFGTTEEGRTEAPVTYFPMSATYGATWAPKGAVTELNVGVTAGLRGLGSDELEFENNRFAANGAFIYIRGDLSHTHDLPKGFQAYGKVQGQLASGPLVSSEQFGGGGVGTARGYLEAEALGDNAIFGTIELRSPSLLGWLPARWKGNDWRIHAFADAGILSLHDPLPEQESRFDLASFGLGSRLDLLNFLHGSVDVGVPLTSQQQTTAHHPFVTFRVWADF
jgi:hemolysin activation/secretion protein